MLSSPLVTIAIPAYKSEFLAETIKSALGQSYTNIEVVIVNDCSPNDIKSIVDSFEDQRIIYYENTKNLGKKSIVLNWNRCVDLASGDYFILLCDDDILLPDFVSNLIELSNIYPKCTVFHARKAELMWDGEMNIESAWPEYESGVDFANNFFSGRRFHTIGEFMYRTSMIKRKKYKVFPAGYYSDDASLLLFTDGGCIVSSQVPLYIFRYSDIHVSSNKAYNLGKIKAMHRYYKWVRRRYPDATGYIERKKQEYKSSINYFFSASEVQKLLILPYIPFNISNCRVIMRYYINRFCFWRR